MKVAKLLFIALIAGGMFFTSCASDDQSSVREQALESVANNTATPAATTAPNNAITPTPEAAAPVGPTTKMDFAELEHDFGTIDDGEVASHVYKFKNTGDEPLILSNAKGSCGCTVPEWPREPIAPGASGEIVVKFDSKNKKGLQNKKVTITANTEPANTVLTIKGTVNGKDKAEGVN